MNSRDRLAERLKNALIALLLCSAVLLGWQSEVFGDAQGILDAVSGLFYSVVSGDRPDSGDKRETTEAARPVCIAVTGSGGRCGVKYDMAELDRLYGETVFIFGEALGSSERPREVGASEWQEALGSPGVYYEYLFPVKLSLLARWFGTESGGVFGDAEARRLCVTSGGEVSRLYYQDASTGKFYAAKTASPESASALWDSHSSNGAVFAFEVIARQASKDPYALILPARREHPVFKAQNPLADASEMAGALADLGVSEHVISSYTEPSGSRVYVDNDFTLRVSPDGDVVYRRTESSPPPARAEGVDEGGAVEIARLAVAGTIGRRCGDAAVCLESVEASDGGYKVCFQYVVAGGQVCLGTGAYAAEVAVTGGGAVSEMKLLYRKFTPTGETVLLMPEVLAAAASGGEFVLCYPGGSGDRLEPCWAVPPLPAGPEGGA